MMLLEDVDVRHILRDKATEPSQRVADAVAVLRAEAFATASRARRGTTWIRYGSAHPYVASVVVR